MEFLKRSSSNRSHNVYYATLHSISGVKSSIILALVLSLTVGTLSAADFFKNEIFSNLPKNKLYPQGQIFPFSGYSSPSGDKMKEMGFTATGPTYGNGQAKLAKSTAKAGLKNIWQLHVKYGDVVIDGKKNLAKAAGKKGIDWKKMSLCVEDAVKKVLIQHDDTIGWWALGVEEVRWWNKNEMKYIEVAYNAIKKADPQKRPMWIYMPGHYGAGGMRKYMPFMDMLGQGYYPNFSDRAGYRYWCENVQATVKDFTPDRPMIAVTEMFREPKTDEDYNLIGAFVRHDVWMALIHKFKGIVVFSFGNRRNFDSYGEYLYQYSVVAKELTREGGLGNVVLFGEDMNDIKLTITKGPETVTVPKKEGKPAQVKKYTYPTVKYRDMRHNTGRYFFAASSSKEPVHAVIKGLPKQAIKVINAANGKVLGETSNGTFELTFGPLGVNLLKFEAK